MILEGYKGVKNVGWFHSCRTCRFCFDYSRLYGMEKRKISLFHDYHYDKVSEEDKKAFCTISGIGVVLIEIGLFITSIIIGITDSMWSFIPFVIGFVAGLIMLIYSGIKYNR